MSEPALDWAGTFTHPRVNDVAREVLKAFARLIPEGETTTPLIGMGVIARSARVNRRTVWTWLPVLVEIGAVRVVDGGQGRRARYTLVHVPGVSPPIAAPLPLRADLQPVPRRPRPASDTADLFDDPPIVRSESEELVIPITSWAARTITRITSYTSWPLQLLSTLRRFVTASITRITSYTSWRPIVRRAGEELVIRTCDPCDPQRAIEALLNTARDVPPLKETTTTTAPRDGPTAVKPPPCRWLGTKHAWCDRRFHVPRDFHDEERCKLPRQPGETDADLDVQLFARYAAVFGAVPPTADLRGFKNDFEICRAYLRASSPETITKARAPIRDTRAPIPDNDLFARAAEERRRRAGGS